MENYRNDFNNYSKEAKWSFWRVFWWIFGVVLLIGAIIWTIDLVLTPAKTTKEVIQKTLDADNVLENYEWYKRQYHDWKAINVKIKQADNNVENFKNDAGPRENWDYMDKEESARLKSIADGLRYQREDIESTYNARSQMLNRKIFKTSDLPYQLYNGEEDRELE